MSTQRRLSAVCAALAVISGLSANAANDDDDRSRPYLDPQTKRSFMGVPAGPYNVYDPSTGNVYSRSDLIAPKEETSKRMEQVAPPDAQSGMRYPRKPLNNPAGADKKNEEPMSFETYKTAYKIANEAAYEGTPGRGVTAVKKTDEELRTAYQKYLAAFKRRKSSGSGHNK